MTLRRFGFLLLYVCCGLTAAGVLAFSAVYWLLPRLEPDPMPLLEAQTPARIWTDENGSWLFVRRTYDVQWRFAVGLDQISPAVIQTILAVEDRNFYRHAGVDWQAVLRAAGQNLFSRRIVSGASTISMQLAGMTEPGMRRSWLRKFRQLIKARRLEQLYSKDRILCEYLNRLPFGGKYYGIECAARYYFGRPAAHLNRAEAALLCGLPQRPNAYRPDRFLLNALERRDRVLRQMAHLGILTKREAERIRKQEPLRFRDFHAPADFQRLSRSPDSMYFTMAAGEAGSDRFTVKCAYQPETARMMRHILKEQLASLPGVRDGAGMLIENATGRVVVLIGTLTSGNVPGSQVNAAAAIRSAGSALKPFLYAEAAAGGLLTLDTVLTDLPVNYGAYAPGNSDGKFRGEVRAWDALSSSLNTPAVRLLAELGTDRVAELFRKLHLDRKVRTADRDGLSMALGSGGYTLFGLTSAYTVFPRDGKWRAATFLTEANPNPDQQIFPEGTGALTARMLRSRQLPDSLADIAWKTGTSNGNRDAWCFAFTPDWTLGVWFGNKSGAASSSLAGYTAAAPAAGKIAAALIRNRRSHSWQDFPDSFQTGSLCAASGLLASSDCGEQFAGTVLKNVPLRVCSRCSAQIKKRRLRIVSPLPGTYAAGPDGRLILTLHAGNGKKTPHWLLNGRYIGSFQQKQLSFLPGKHTLQIMSGDPAETGCTVTFRVAVR